MSEPNGSLTSTELQRVKVYRLNAEGHWDDKGQGQVTIEFLEASQSPGIVVISEEDLSKTLLIHKLSQNNNYQQSGEDTIITWTDSDIGVDVALSFQEADGCTSIWDEIQRVQQGGSWPSQETSNGDTSPDNQVPGPPTEEPPPGSRRFVVDEFEQAGMSPDGVGPSTQGPVDLPFPEMRNLGELARALSSVSMWQKERVSRQVLAKGWLDRLLELFHQCEDLEDTESLHHLYTAMKGIVMLNDITLLELLFSEAHVMDVVGMLEYDPEAQSKANHREWLSEKAVFKEVVPIADPTIRPKIHQTYRYGYIKDVILPRTLDDATFATISSLMLFNNVEVVMGLQKEPGFLPELFRRLEAGPSDPAWGDLLAFLQEMCGLAKHLQPSNCTALMSRLHQLGLFQVLTIVMEQGSNELKLKAVDVLLSMVTHDSRPLRDFLLQQPSQTLFGLLMRPLMRGAEAALQSAALPDWLAAGLSEACKGAGWAPYSFSASSQAASEPLREGGDGGLQESALEVLRCLLDPEGMTANFERNDFLDVFYEKHINALVSMLALACEQGSEGSKVPPSVLGLIVDLLCFCVVHHSYRIKYYILRNNVLSKVLKLLGRRERWLAVAAIRFLRTCLALKDEFYNRYIVREHLLEPVMEAFLANGSKYNLLNSAVLELIDFIRKENIKSLMGHIVEQYLAQGKGGSQLGVRLREHTYTDTFGLLRRKHEQASERQQGPPGETSTPPVKSALRQRRDARELDKDEEAFFKEGDDEDDPAGLQSVRDTPSPVHNGVAQPPQRPLVDYGDDDDDEPAQAHQRFLAGGKRQSPAPSSPSKRSRSIGFAPINFNFKSAGSSDDGAG